MEADVEDGCLKNALWEGEKKASPSKLVIVSLFYSRGTAIQRNPLGLFGRYYTRYWTRSQFVNPSSIRISRRDVRSKGSWERNGDDM
jgi:hypothetical protein